MNFLQRQTIQLLWHTVAVPAFPAHKQAECRRKPSQLKFCFYETTCFDLVLVCATKGHAQCSHSPEVTVWRKLWTNTLYIRFLRDNVPDTLSSSTAAQAIVQVDTKSPLLCQGIKSGRSAWLTLAKLRGHITFSSHFPGWCIAFWLHLCSEACGSQV